MFARSLTAIALAATLIGCAPSMRGHREYYGTSWDDWRGILGNSVVLASGDGTAIHGEVTQVTFFPVTQVRIRTDERDTVTLSFDEARQRVHTVKRSREYDWSRLLGTYVEAGTPRKASHERAVSEVVTSVSLDPEPHAIVMDDTGPEMVYRTVSIEELRNSAGPGAAVSK